MVLDRPDRFEAQRLGHVGQRQLVEVDLAVRDGAAGVLEDGRHSDMHGLVPRAVCRMVNGRSHRLGRAAAHLKQPYSRRHMRAHAHPPRGSRRPRRPRPHHRAAPRPAAGGRSGGRDATSTRSAPFRRASCRAIPTAANVQGTLYVSRPGRMRFQYDPPSQLKIVADGPQVTMWDPANKDFGQWPIGWTAASFLVKEPFSCRGDITVVATSARRRPAGADPGADPQAAGGQGDRPLVGKSDAAARLEHHRQPRQQGRVALTGPADRHAARRFAVQVRRPRRRRRFCAAATATESYNSGM